jgi:hypothetical protein
MIPRLSVLGINPLTPSREIVPHLLNQPLLSDELHRSQTHVGLYPNTPQYEAGRIKEAAYLISTNPFHLNRYM